MTALPSAARQSVIRRTGLATLEAPARTPATAVEWAEAQLRRWQEQDPQRQTLLLSLPAPEVDPETLLEISDPDLAFFWHPPEGPATAGIGAAHRIQLAGGERFQRLKVDAERLWSGLTAIGHPDCRPPAPRLYGGLAFDVGAADDEPWGEFGDGCFTLPRLAYVHAGDAATLTLAVRGDELPGGRDDLVAELESILSRLADRRPRPVASPMLIEIERPSRSLFARQVEAIRETIVAGDFAKIVAAGRSRATLAAALGTGAVLRRLRHGLLASNRFAFCRRHSTFLGATPERLIARRGRAIETEALAGSIASGADHRELLASGKDQQEHQLVVDAIVRRLAPLCETLEVPSRPRIRELRDVLHLLTPITGRLAEPRHILDLVEEAHPTPAVGGVPTAAALDWIRDHERDPRGWYAAPVGWFDAAGDGEFAVALRSALVRESGRSGSEAFIYAGAGIVRDSDPDLEYTETELKKQALLTALGA